MDDSELLRAYCETRDEAAFGELVRRYRDLVYATARRGVEGDSLLAQEVAQSAFVLLARKSSSLLEHPVLAGWLYRTARHLAARARRTETRRRLREREAATMNDDVPSQTEPDAERLLPMLDEALAGLSEADRLAVLLRFSLKKSMREVGQGLGVSEAAAKMRVGRTVERLREFFARQGITCSAGGLAVFLAEHSTQAAPAALAGKILVRVSTTGGTALTLGGAAKLLLLMTTTKSKLALGAALVAALLTGVGVYQWSQDSSSEPGAAAAPPRPGKAAPGAGSSMPVRPQIQPAGSGGVAANTKNAIKLLRAALSAPLPKSGALMSPDEAVSNAISFFADRAAAFQVLKAAIEHPLDLMADSTDEKGSEWMIRNRALGALQLLAKDVPEVIPFLWQSFKNDEITLKAPAFSTLKQIGFKADDAPVLIESLPNLGASPAMRIFVPQALGELLNEHPQLAATALPSLRTLLNNPDEKVRVSAASALARFEMSEPVVQALGSALESSDKFMNHVGASALQNAGADARALVPALISLSERADEKGIREGALKALGKIQPSLAQTMPEVARLLGTENLGLALGEKVQHGTASFDELRQALGVPRLLHFAIDRLAELGPPAKPAIPAMLQAVRGDQGWSEDAREKLVQAIHKIDPQFVVQRVEEPVMTTALMEARIALGEREDRVNDFVMQHAGSRSWWTREETVAFSKKLAEMDRKIRDAFVGRLIRDDPSMAAVLGEPTE